MDIPKKSRRTGSVFAFWALLSGHACAAGVDYGAVEGLLIIAIALVVLAWLFSVWVVRSIAKLVGPTSANVATLAYVIASVIGTAIFIGNHDLKARRLNENNTREANLEAEAESDACRLRAVEEFSVVSLTPVAAFVQADQAFQHDYLPAFNRGERHPDARVNYVDRLPTPRPPGAIFVEARVFREPVPSTDSRRIGGVIVEVTDHEGKPLGRRVDIDRNHDWCLGPEGPDISTRRFVKQISGIDIGVARGPESDLERFPPIASPIGDIGPIEAGRFKVRQPADIQTLNDEYPGLGELLLANHCEVPPLDSSLQGDITCGAGRPFENRFSKHSPLAGLALRDGWLGVFSVRSSEAADALDVIRRDQSGEVKMRWRIRFPSVRADDGRSFRPAIDSTSLDGQTLRVGLLFQSGHEYPVSDDGKPRYTTYYQRRRMLTVQLDIPPAP